METRHFIKTLCKQKMVKTFFLSIFYSFKRQMGTRLKNKILRGNYASFFSKVMKKAIYIRIRLRKKMLIPSKENDRKEKTTGFICISETKGN